MKQKEEATGKAYTFHYDCRNCQHGARYLIPIGTRTEEYFVDKICTECGCLVKGEM